MGNSSSVSQKFQTLEPIEIERSENKLWKDIYDGILNSSSSSEDNVSVFEFQASSKISKSESGEVDKDIEKVAVTAGRNALKLVKQIRHPNVIKYIDSVVVNEEDQSHYFLGTEPVYPLRKVLSSLQFQEILLGIYQIASALCWLHSHLKIVHNNVHVDSIYVSTAKQRKWVLGDFHFALFYKDMSQDVILKSRDLRYNETLTPEEGFREFKKYDIYTRDVWALGKCISKLFVEIKELQKKTLKEPGNQEDLMRKFMSDQGAKAWMRAALDSDPVKREPIEKLLQCKIFSEDDFVNIMTFLDDIRVRKSDEKEKMLRKFNQKLQKIPFHLVKKRIVPRLLTLPFVTEPAACFFLPHLFCPNHDTLATNKNILGSQNIQGLLSLDDFGYFVKPFIQKCFASKNRSLRCRALQNLEYYIYQFEQDYILKTLLEEIILSIEDTSDDLVMFAMNGLVILSKYILNLASPKQQDTAIAVINMRIVRVLHRSACSETVIAVRSHALFCLMELWSIPKVNKNIILSALHYALYDPTSFEIKLYCLNVILMNLRRFDPRELVSVILKLVLPLTLHETSEVRSKASQVIKSSLDYVQELQGQIGEFTYGMVSRDDKPHPIVAKLQPIFPPESSHPVQRKSLFHGANPKVSIYTMETSASPQGKQKTSSRDSVEINEKSTAIESQETKALPKLESATIAKTPSLSSSQSPDIHDDDGNQEEWGDWSEGKDSMVASTNISKAKPVKDVGFTGEVDDETSDKDENGDDFFGMVESQSNFEQNQKKSSSNSSSTPVLEENLINISDDVQPKSNHDQNNDSASWDEVEITEEDPNNT